MTTLVIVHENSEVQFSNQIDFNPIKDIFAHVNMALDG